MTEACAARAGWGFYAVTYAVMAGVYVCALLTRSVWGPLQLVGATAGALIAFVFPALLILRSEGLPQVLGRPGHSLWKHSSVTSWLLVYATVCSLRHQQPCVFSAEQCTRS